jgi:hypothetical protein
VHYGWTLSVEPGRDPDRTKHHVVTVEGPGRDVSSERGEGTMSATWREQSFEAACNAAIAFVDKMRSRPA